MSPPRSDSRRPDPDPGGAAPRGATSKGAGSEAQKTQKGERTRAHILEVSLRLFREHGFEKTSMRRIAKEAEVSVGNAYYYFESKEHLVQGFYERANQEHIDHLRPFLEVETRFRERLEKAVRSKIELSEPYHGLAGILFRNAADPRSPLNPFSPQSSPVRDRAVALMAEVVEGSDLQLPEDVLEQLPDTLWLYLMSVILFWLHDESEGRAHTHRLIDESVPLVVMLTQSFGNPMFAPWRESMLRFLDTLRTGLPRRSEGGTES